MKRVRLFVNSKNRVLQATVQNCLVVVFALSFHFINYTIYYISTSLTETRTDYMCLKVCETSSQGPKSIASMNKLNFKPKGYLVGKCHYSLPTRFKIPRNLKEERRLVKSILWGMMKEFGLT